MRIIEVLQTQDFKEVTFEVKFLWWKWNKTYRKFPDNTILKFKHPNKYYFVGTFECIDINYLFSLPTQKSDERFKEHQDALERKK